MQSNNKIFSFLSFSIVSVLLLVGCVGGGSGSPPKGDDFLRYLESQVLGKDFYEAAKLLEKDGFEVEFVINHYAVSAIKIDQSADGCLPRSIIEAFFASSCSERWYAILPVRDNIVSWVTLKKWRYSYNTYAS